MNLSILVALVLAVTLCIKPEWSSEVIRTVSSAFDAQLWRGFVANGPLACDCVRRRRFTDSSGVTVSDAVLFTYKPIEETELQRRRFCIVLAMPTVPTVQGALVRSLRWIAALTATGGRADEDALCGVADDAIVGDAHSALRVLKQWRKTEAPVVAAASAAADTTPSNGVDLSFKIYDGSFTTQLAPIALAGAHRNLLGGASLVPERERSRSLSLHNVSAASSPGAADSRLVKLFQLASQMFAADAGLDAIRVVAPPSQLFHRRGFPLWNIVPDEHLVVEVKRRADAPKS